MSTENQLTTEEEAEQAAEEAEAVEAEEAESPAEEDKPREPTDEIKIVITAKADDIFVGLLSPNCDPIYHTLKGTTMAAALKKIPGYIKAANEQWDERPRYPKANLPEPEPPAASPRPAASRPARQERQAQPSFF